MTKITPMSFILLQSLLLQSLLRVLVLTPSVYALTLWFYNTDLVAELSNLLPGKRPAFYLRRDFNKWLPMSGCPGWLCTLLTCPHCGSCHAAFWVSLIVTLLERPHGPWQDTAVMFMLGWWGSAGLALRMRKDHF